MKNPGRVLLPRLAFCIVGSMLIAVIGVTLVLKASEFIDLHPLWSGMSMLFIISVIGFGWMVKWLRRK